MMVVCLQFLKQNLIMKKLLTLLLLAPALCWGQTYPSPSFNGELNAVGSCGVSASAADNATALNACIATAIANNQVLHIPAAATCYKYTAPLTISGTLTIRGDYVSENWGATSSFNSANAPTGTPALLGSVLCPSSNGSDGIDITGVSPVVNISNIGILFQTSFSGTGNGINVVPPYTGSTNEQGLTGAQWTNVKVFGHDGNHYGFYVQNPLYDSFYDLRAYGGGGFKAYGESFGTISYGNFNLYHPYFVVLAGGSAHALVLDAASTGMGNITMFRPQTWVANFTGLSPATPPTSAQYNFYQNQTTVSNLSLIWPDFESNVGSPSFISPLPGQFMALPNSSIMTSAPSGDPGATTSLYAQNGGANSGGGNINLYAGSAGSGSSNNGSIQLQSAAASGNLQVNLFTPAATSSSVWLNFQKQNTTEIQEGYSTGGIFFMRDYANSDCGFFTYTQATSLQIMNGGCAYPTIIGNTSATLGLTASSGGITLTGVSTGTNADFLCLSSGGVVLLQSSACTISSARFKEDIQPLGGNATDELLALNVSTFKLRDGDKNGDPNASNTQVGLIAEDVAKVDPRLAIYEDDMKTPKSYRQESVIALLVKAVQEQQAEIEALKKKDKSRHRRTR